MYLLNIISVVKFQISKIVGPGKQNFCLRINIFKGFLKICQQMLVRQKLNMMLENKVFNKSWSPKLIFLNKIKMKIDLECTIFTLFNKLSLINRNFQIFFPSTKNLALLKGPTIFEIHNRTDLMRAAALNNTNQLLNSSFF